MRSIRKARPADLSAVAAIYEQIHSAEEAGEQTVGWVRGVYPTRATAEAALSRGELFVLEEDGAVCAAALINQSQVDVYESAPWIFPARAEEVCVMHTLVVSPAAAGRGCGQRFMAFYEEYARQNGWPELRIDTNARNLRARALYRKLGYREIGIVPATFNGIPGVELVLLEKHLKEERR